jgi:dipeptidyl aminopeptidase/acylaminoacyl peptidase
VLLIHGADDTVVPYLQSSLHGARAQERKQAHGICHLKHEDHWLSGSQTRLQMLEASVEFLRKYNPP